MRLTQIDTFLIRMLYLSAAGIVMLTVVGAESIASALFYLTFVLVVLLWLAGALNRVGWLDAVLLLTVGVSLCHVIINAWLEDTAISFGYLKKYLIFICTLMYFLAAYKYRIDEKTERFLLRTNSVLVLFLVLYFCLNRTEAYLLRGRISDYLTFGFTNPNLTALFLLCLFTGEVYQIFRNKTLAKRFWHLLLAAEVLYFIWETGSRNGLLTVAIVVLLLALLYLLPKGFRISKWAAFLVAVWPIAFALAYLAFVKYSWIQELFSFLTADGKPLNARVSIWQYAMQYYSQSPLLGAYSQISRGTGMSQLHNTHVDILVSYGTAVLILACYLLYGMINSKTTENIKEDSMARICFAGTIIMGMGEAALVSGGLGIYLFAGMFLLLCNREKSQSSGE